MFQIKVKVVQIMHIIAGQYGHRKIQTPKSEKTRPTASHLRETLFNICQGYIQGSRFLDLFAGSGAVGLEALSRGACSATFVESDKAAIRCIQTNIESLKVQNQCKLLPGDVFRHLKNLENLHQQFDIIFADPPYQTRDQVVSYSETLIRLIDQGSLLAPEGVLFIEEAFDFQPQLDDLKTLHLKNSRRISSAILQYYVKR